MQDTTWRFLSLLLVSLGLSLSGVNAQEDYPVLTEESIEWKLLPSDLIRKVHPLTSPEDLRLKLGATEDGQQYLRVRPPRLGDLSFGIRSTEENGSYIASSKSAVYWPRQHLLRLEGAIIVSSTHCNLKGETFDIHLYHDTVRLENPSEILMDEVSLPLVSEGIRISGIGHSTIPDFEWDPVIEKNARVEKPTPLPTLPTESAVTVIEEPTPMPPKQYQLHIGERWELTFQGEEIDLESLEAEIKRIGKEEPQSSMLVEQSAGANPVQVRRIHQSLDGSGIAKVKTTIIPSGIAQGELNPEVDPKPADQDLGLPRLPERGGKLLWIHEPGRYNLNGKEYSEPALRQALRVYAREYSNLTLVIASSRKLPPGFLRELILDLRAYGVTDILVGVESAKAVQ